VSVTVAGETAYAGLVSRFLAYALDAVIVSMLTGTGAVVLASIASVAGYESEQLARAVLSTYIIFLPSILAIYCAMFWQLAGRTPGMAVLGLRVVTVDGRPMGWFVTLVRALLLAYFPIGALWLLVNRRHQAVHDKIVRTTVVRRL
jgi:uncharacterized RDD family membrane protein YckC